MSTTHEEFPVNEWVARWIDEVADGMGGYAFAATKLTERHRRYYAARVRDLAHSLSDMAWPGTCPFCAGWFEVDGLSGWWRCLDCYRRGEMYTLEYRLFGEHDPQRWDACRQSAEELMQ